MRKKTLYNGFLFYLNKITAELTETRLMDVIFVRITKDQE